MSLISVLLFLLVACVCVAPFFMLSVRIVCSTGVSFVEAFRRTLLTASMTIMAVVALGLAISRFSPPPMVYRILVPVVYVVVPLSVAALCYEPMRIPPDSYRLGWLRALKVATLQYLLVVVFLIVPLYCLRFLTG